MNHRHKGGDLATKHWVELPNKERLRIHLHWLGAVVLSFEPPSHPNQVHVLKGVVPIGKMGRRSFFEYLQNSGMAYDYVEAPYSFHFRGHLLRLDATLEPYALFGFIPMPRWFVQSVHVTLWVDGSRYREFVL